MDPPWDFDEAGKEPSLTQLAQCRGNELWFATKMAQTVLVGDREVVLRSFFDALHAERAPREQVLVAKLARMTDSDACVVYGDPVEALLEDKLGFYSIRPLGDDFRDWDPDKLERAATAARQARFEHGQSGTR